MWLRVPLRFEFGRAGDAQRLIIERLWPDEPVVLERSSAEDSVASRPKADMIGRPSELIVYTTHFAGSIRFR